MSVINTNTKALFSQNALQVTGRSLTKAMEQLSSGKRINTAGDDAAGLAIATRMTQQIRSLDQAFRNAGDAIALIQTAEGATNEITDMLQRMRELAIQAINDTNNNEQRSYLDLEFQQLKQEIARTAEMTEWNGFKILNGSTGTPVGERPVYKTTSTDAFFENADPSSERTLSSVGAGSGKVFEMLLPKADGDFESLANETFTYTISDGTTSVDIPISGAKTAVQVAEIIADKLAQDSAFGPASGRTVSLELDQDGEPFLLRVGLDPSETLASITFARTKNMGATVNEVPITFTSLPALDVTAANTESFARNGNFIYPGVLEMEFQNTRTLVAGIEYQDVPTLTATFTTERGDVYTLAGTVSLGDPNAGPPAIPTTITFSASNAANSGVISNDLEYSLYDVSGNPMSILTDASSKDIPGGKGSAREFSIQVQVEGSVPRLRTGDLVINGVTIPESLASDDLLSPLASASGSAIAIAAAINKKTSETGVAAVVNETRSTGFGMTAGAAVTGVLNINGYSTPEITTVVNNLSESRREVVAAINFVSHLTGVEAIDTQNDQQGVVLVAKDGRNIELQFETIDSTESIFKARTGLNPGVFAGSYALESRVEAPVLLEAEDGFDISRARLAAGDYQQNISRLVSAERTVATSATPPEGLSAGDLSINGIAIPASRAADDEVSSILPTSSVASASAKAIAAAVNSVSGQTGVTAEVYGAFVEGRDAATVAVSGNQTLYVNGTAVTVSMLTTQTAGERAQAVADAINLKTGLHGVEAGVNELGGVTLSTVDGRNLSVWFNSTAVANASEFGLASTYPESAVSGIAGASASTATAATVYGRVTLVSSAPFTVSPGANGYNTDSNFEELGFQPGTFGGEVDEATSKMTPPRTGRIAFQVGASAGQLITIDLADFGKGGPITSTITGDVDNAVQTNKISTRDDASAVLSKLDAVMDKVNATRAVMGAVMNRLQYAMDTLSNASMNQAASRSQIEDADYARASTELAKTQLMQQAATAVLAQANQSQQSVLQLLQG